jgi:hypothetical protein
MILNQSNPASEQFVRGKNTTTRKITSLFFLIFIVATGALSLFSGINEKSPPSNSGIIELDPAIPPNAQSIRRNPEVSLDDFSFLKIPRVDIKALAVWDTLELTGTSTTYLFSANIPLENLVAWIEMQKGGTGFVFSGRRSSATDISYTFYKNGRFGMLTISPKSASTSQIIVKP